MVRGLGKKGESEVLNLQYAVLTKIMTQSSYFNTKLILLANFPFPSPPECLTQLSSWIKNVSKTKPPQTYLYASHPSCAQTWCGSHLETLHGSYQVASGFSVSWILLCWLSYRPVGLAEKPLLSQIEGKKVPFLTDINPWTLSCISLVSTTSGT